MFYMCLQINKSVLQDKLFLDNSYKQKYDNQECTDHEEIESLQDLLTLLCDELENYNILMFKVEGFGELPWPVDISTDLLSILEQLPDFLEFMDTNSYNIGYIDFYEQGIQRRLIFNKVKTTFRITCQPFPIKNFDTNSDISWGLNVEEEPIEIEKLKTMIREMIKIFVSIANEFCPRLTNHKYFRDWCKNKYIEDCLQEKKQ